MPQPIKVDIVSDIVCPWCYIGQSRLKKALEQLPAGTVSISWKPFQLRPDMPVGGMDSQRLMQEKFGDKASGMIAQVEENAHKEGLPMDFSKVSKAPNTIEAHRLMWFAQKEGKEDALAHILFKAYFAEGKDVEDRSSLANLGKEAGLSEEALRQFTETEEGRDEVRYEERQYRASGISAVPSFIVNDKYLLQGAQPAEAFLELFNKVSPKFTEVGKGPGCEGDDCEV